MSVLTTIYGALLLISTVVSLLLVFVVFPRRNQRGALPLLGVVVACFVWSGTYLAQLNSDTVPAKLLWNNLRFVGPALVSTSVLLLALAYTNREELLTRRFVALLFLPGIVANAFVWTNDWHRLVRESVVLVDYGAFVAADIAWGPVFWAQAGFNYLLLVATTVIFLQELASRWRTSAYRGQIGLIVLAIFIPWGGNVVYLVSDSPIDVTPITLCATGVLLVVAMFHYQLFELVPVARDVIVSTMDDGVLVVGSKGRIVDANAACLELLETDENTLVGDSIETVFSSYPDLVDHLSNVEEFETDSSISVTDEHRHLDVEVSLISDAMDRFAGHVVVLRDVTEQRQKQAKLERQRRELERQNERLDEFAGVVSHDLRNPLNVVDGRIALADIDEEHAEPIQSNLDRTFDIIDDALQLAKQGKTVSEWTLLDLRAVAESAWDNVATADATLVVKIERQVRGNRGRVQRIFENLFRNAVEHGPRDVTVTVGDLFDGFYVGDDGPGIPEGERDSVLEQGYTTRADGTGFGLAIVNGAVEAHDWTIDVTESESGGVRFEIRGVKGTELKSYRTT